MGNAILCDSVEKRAPGASGRCCFRPQVVRRRPVADDTILSDSVGLGMQIIVVVRVQLERKYLDPRGVAISSLAHGINHAP